MSTTAVMTVLAAALTVALVRVCVGAVVPVGLASVRVIIETAVLELSVSSVMPSSVLLLIVFGVRQAVRIVAYLPVAAAAATAAIIRVVLLIVQVTRFAAVAWLLVMTVVAVVAVMAVVILVVVVVVLLVLTVAVVVVAFVVTFFARLCAKRFVEPLPIRGSC